MKYSVLVIAFITSFLTQFSFAADADIYSDKKLGAIKGADPVAYWSLEEGAKAVIGEPDISHEYKGATWHFASEENRQAFIANPEKYLPEYGGYCAFAVSHGFTQTISPNRWNIVDGKLYLNYNWIAERKWNKDRAGAIARADGHWPTVLTACEEHDNCRN